MRGPQDGSEQAPKIATQGKKKTSPEPKAKQPKGRKKKNPASPPPVEGVPVSTPAAEEIPQNPPIENAQ